MSISAINDQSDILWISTRIPAIASIYYHLHLQQSHTLYCPDDVSSTSTSSAASPPVKQHVRDLARNILRVIDSNDYKKLALHFMEPLSTTRCNDLVHFLLKRRSRLKISHLTLPCPLIQHYYLSGWSYSTGLDPTSFWPRQCQALPTQEPDLPSRHISASNIYTEMEFKQPFILSSHEFTKKALFVNITQDMIILPSGITNKNANDEKNIFELKDTALLAIQGWIDAISSSQSENGNTLVFIMDEASLYVESTLLQLNQDERKKTLAHGRTQVWKKIRSLATELPIYLYLNYFNLTSTKPTLPGILAWLQQRHHICISRSILLTWKRYCFDPTQKSDTDSPSTTILTQLEQVELTSIAKYDRPKWKMEFTHLSQKLANIAYTDQNYISLGKLNKDLLAIETSKQHLLPLLGDEQQLFDPFVHESGDFFDHSVSSSNEQVAHSWIIAVQQQQQQNSTTGTEHSEMDNNDTKLDENDLETIDNTTDEAREEELEKLADNLDHDKIRDYISNTGAYARGEDLLHTLSQTTYSWDDEKNLLVVFSEAKGTSDNPYQVYLALDRTDGTKDALVSDGYCTCPVGKTGKCKHCVAVLIRFMINVDDFEQNQQQIVMPQVNQESTTKQPFQPSTDDKKTSPSTTIPVITASSTTEPSPLSSTPLQPASQVQPQQSPPDEHAEKQTSSPPPLPLPSQDDTKTKSPSQRRVLPWNMTEEKTGKSKKRSRPTSENTTETPNDSLSIHQPTESLVEDVYNAAVKKPRCTNTNTRRTPTKERRIVDSDSDSDDIFNDRHNLESTKQQSDKKTSSRKSTRSKRQPTTSHTIDDAAMWEDDFGNVNMVSQQTPPNTSSSDKKTPASRKRSARPKQQPIMHAIDDAAMWEDDFDNVNVASQQPPSSAPASTTTINSMIDDDDQVQMTALPTASSQLSPMRTMQQSNLSLPITDLDILTSKSDTIDDSDTLNEDDLPLSLLNHMDMQRTTSLNTEDKNDQQNSGVTDTQPQQQFVHNAQALLQRSATSDLFDELDL